MATTFTYIFTYLNILSIPSLSGFYCENLIYFLTVPINTKFDVQGGVLDYLTFIGISTNIVISGRTYVKEKKISGGRCQGRDPLPLPVHFSGIKRKTNVSF